MTGEEFEGAAKDRCDLRAVSGRAAGLRNVSGGRLSMMVEGIAAFIGPMAFQFGQASGGHLAGTAAELSEHPDGRGDAARLPVARLVCGDCG